MSTPESQSVGGRGQVASPEVEQALKERWRGLMVAGILAIFGGFVAIAVPAVASVAIAIFIGWMLLFAGTFLLIGAWSVRGVGNTAIAVLWAVLTLFAGFYLILAPLSGTVTLTFVLVVYFLVMGSARLFASFADSHMPHAGLVGVSGALSILVGLLILADLPSSADWALGLLVGIDFLFAGFGLVQAAIFGRQLDRAGGA
jgi:uncharacterized membrane protein HdeD (DUF308 family)